jgi:amino acid transporter
MASRVAYGLARRDQAPRWLGVVHPTTQTPLAATGVMTAVILVLATFFIHTAWACEFRDGCR